MTEALNARLNVRVDDDVLAVAGRLRACVGPLVRRLRQIQAEGELSLSQSAVLARLERNGPATPAALAAGEQIRPQSVGAILVELQARALVSRRRDPDDGRRVVFSITEAGRAWVLGNREQKAQRLAQALAASFTAAERDRLVAAIPLLERLGQVL